MFYKILSFNTLNFKNKCCKIAIFNAVKELLVFVGLTNLNSNIRAFPKLRGWNFFKTQVFA